MIDISKLKCLGIFAGGVLFGTAGVKLLSSKDAKKVYTSCTAAALRAKAEAKLINEERAAREAASVQEDADTVQTEEE